MLMFLLQLTEQQAMEGNHAVTTHNTDTTNTTYLKISWYSCGTDMPLNWKLS